MGPAVSIIVPVYNAEETLRRCVDSILGQEFQDFEVLLVDDGSTDSSGAILDEYARCDSRVKAIHKPNTGVSDTRNVGIDRAEGEYLEFLDSDDWITPDATKLLLRSARENGCDLVIADFYRVVGDRVSHKGDIEDSGVLTREEFAACMMENPADYYYGVLWNKLYRRDIIHAHGIRMNTEISWCEDFLFNLEYIHYAERFFALQVPIYYYLKRKGSLVNSHISLGRTVNMKLTMFDYYNEFLKSVLNEEEYQRNRGKLYGFLFDSAQDGVVAPPLISNSTRLGDERVPLTLPAGEGVLQTQLRLRRLLEYYLQSVALKNNLELADALLLLTLYPGGEITASVQELAELTGLTRREVSASAQRLIARGLLARRPVPRPRRELAPKVEPKPKPEPPRFTLCAQSAAEPVFSDLAQAQADWRSARTAAPEMFDGPSV